MVGVKCLPTKIHIINEMDGREGLIYENVISD